MKPLDALRRRPVRLPLPIVRTGLVLQRFGLGGPLPLGLARRYLNGLAWATLATPSGVETSWTRLGGRRALLVRPRALDRPAQRTIMYLHGGGYVVGSPASYRSMAGFLALAAGADVYLPEYRLAPEHPFPAARDDARAAYRDLVGAVGVDPSRLVIGGDSAGGGLAVATTQSLITEGASTPAGLVLLSPWVDLAQRAPDGRDHLVTDAWGEATAVMYAGDLPLGDPGLSPANGPLAGLPPTLVHFGAAELLAPQVRAFVDKLEAAGVDVTVHEFDWMWHVAHIQAAVLARGVDAIGELGDWVRNRTAS